MRIVAESLRRSWFWVAVVGLQVLILLVTLRSVVLGLVLVAGVALVVILMQVVGTRAGTRTVAVALVVTTLVLPGELALTYRIPVGGGGIFIIDLLLGLLLVSWCLVMLVEGDLRLTRSPVTLPLMLFLLQCVVAGVVGVLGANDLKTILQDARGLAYFVLFPYVLWEVRTRDDVVFWLKILGGCMFAGFALGVFYSVMGAGMQLTYVESGVSRFPAPNQVFVLSTALAAGIIVVWPSGTKRPVVLWAALAVSLIGVMLALVRGFWIGLAAGAVYLVLAVTTAQKVRLVAGGIGVLAVLGVGTAALNPTVFESVVTRASAVAAYNADPSVQYRLIENRAVMAQIEQHPVLGNGLGKTYLFDFSRYGVAPFHKAYIHNNYLWFAQRLGLVGVGLFAWMMVAFLLSWRGLRDRLAVADPWLGGTIVGSRVMIVALLVISITSPQFNVKGEVAVIGMVMGLAEVAGSLVREST